MKDSPSPFPQCPTLTSCSLYLASQSDDSSDEGSLHIDTDTKPGRNAKVKKESGSSAAGILDLLQASEEVGALEYNPNRWALTASAALRAQAGPGLVTQWDADRDQPLIAESWAWGAARIGLLSSLMAPVRLTHCRLGF